MRAVTIKEARASLNRLVDAALRGEQVVLMRRSKHVAAIVPITSEELELPTRLTDLQAERFWRNLADERAAGNAMTFESIAAAIDHLANRPARRRLGPAASRGKRASRRTRTR